MQHFPFSHTIRVEIQTKNKMIMKEWMEPINSELPLAKAFNRIISDLELLRIMTNPRIFSDSTDKE